ncbi:MAG: hypothetical protein Q9220_001924 [cf. Caloplaca sp. 1 TL-2023]
MPSNHQPKVYTYKLLYSDETLITYVIQKRKRNLGDIDIPQTDIQQQDLPPQPKIAKLSLRPKVRHSSLPVLDCPDPSTSKAIPPVSSKRALFDVSSSNIDKVDDRPGIMPSKPHRKQLDASRRVTRGKKRRLDPLEPVATSLLDRAQLMPGIEQTHTFRPSSPFKHQAATYPTMYPKELPFTSKFPFTPQSDSPPTSAVGILPEQEITHPQQLPSPSSMLQHDPSPQPPVPIFSTHPDSPLNRSLFHPLPDAPFPPMYPSLKKLPISHADELDNESLVRFVLTYRDTFGLSYPAIRHKLSKLGYTVLPAAENLAAAVKGFEGMEEFSWRRENVVQMGLKCWEVGDEEFGACEVWEDGVDKRGLLDKVSDGYYMKWGSSGQSLNGRDYGMEEGTDFRGDW